MVIERKNNFKEKIILMRTSFYILFLFILVYFDSF